VKFDMRPSPDPLVALTIRGTAGRKRSETAIRDPGPADHDPDWEPDVCTAS
jgi:hypothetical protein